MYHLIDQINSLAVDGILIISEKKEYQVHFILTNVLGDNLGLNTLLGFSASFSANYFCRFCESHKKETHISCEEIPHKLRKVVNYTADVAKNDVALTGLNENSIFNNIKYFHVYENYTIDIMHDIFEGICHYDLCHIFLYFIETVHLFTLNILNERKRFFNYGSVDVGNVSNDIKINHLKSKRLKMSASEIMTFIHYIPFMIGDLVPENDEVWKFLIDLTSIVDILLSRYINDSLVNLLRELIKVHNLNYVRLFSDTLKSKHHILTHYPSIINQSGVQDLQLTTGQCILKVNIVSLKSMLDP